MLIKTLLNKVERFKPFVNVSISFAIIGAMKAFVVDIEPSSNSRPLGPLCEEGGAPCLPHTFKPEERDHEDQT